MSQDRQAASAEQTMHRAKIWLADAKRSKIPNPNKVAKANQLIQGVEEALERLATQLHAAEKKALLDYLEEKHLLITPSQLFKMPYTSYNLKDRNGEERKTSQDVPPNSYQDEWLERKREVSRKANHNYEHLTPAQVVQYAKEWVQENRKIQIVFLGKAGYERVQEDLRSVDRAIEEITRGGNEPKMRRVFECLAWIIVLDPHCPNADWGEGRGVLANLLGTIGPHETYFIPRNSDYLPPPHGPVKLGQLVVRANHPASSVDPDGPIPFSGFAGMHVCSDSTTLDISSHGAKYLKNSGFARALGNKLGLDLTRKVKKGQTHKVFNSHKESIEPTEDYIRTSVQRPDAKQSLQGQIHSRTRRLFMVIEIKFASPVGAEAGLREAFFTGTDCASATTDSKVSAAKTMPKTLFSVAASVMEAAPETWRNLIAKKKQKKVFSYFYVYV
ncbi:hypothetical protein BJX65DRAFT_308318 [Aspergillus insuetus]